MAEPRDGYPNLQEAVEAFLRSPLPPGPRPEGPAPEPWVPQIADAEEPAVIEVVLRDAEPELRYFGPPTEGSYVVIDLADGSWAASWELGAPVRSGHLQLPEEIAERVRPGDRVRLTGRWAHVRLEPMAPPDDDWYPQPGRMFVVDGYELI